MVKSVNKINKNKYQKDNKNKIYLYAGAVLALVIAITVYYSIGGSSTNSSSSSSNAYAGTAPSGKVCTENVAYLQSGVDKYKELKGQLAVDVNQLTEVYNGKPFVEKVPACPTGNRYVIENGIVMEKPKQ